MYDNSAVGLPSASAAFDFTISVASNPNRCLAVVVAGGFDGTAQSIASLTATKGASDVAMSSIVDSGSFGNARAFAYQLVGIDTGTVHVKGAITGNWGDNQRCAVGILSLYNVDQGSPIRASAGKFGDSGTFTETVSNNAGDDIYDFIFVGQQDTDTLTVNGAQTQRIANTSVLNLNSGKLAASSRSGGAGSTSMIWTTSADVGGAQIVLAIAAPPPPFTVPRRAGMRPRMFAPGNAR